MNHLVREKGSRRGGATQHLGVMERSLPTRTKQTETAFSDADRRSVEELDRGSENKVGGMARMPSPRGVFWYTQC